MNIVVCVKQVPENLSVGLDRQTHTVRRSEAKAIVNVADRHALELALALKSAAGGNVVAVSMGPAGTDQALRQALAAGADEAYLVTDAALAGSDTGATASVLAAIVRRVSDVGLVVTGELTVDGGTAQTAPRLAEALGWPVVTSVYEASLEGATLSAGRNAESRREAVTVSGPAVLSVSLDSPKPRIPNAMGVMKAAKKPLTTWSLADLGLEPASVGQEGSCTWVTRSFKPEKREKGETLTGTPDELAKALLGRLARKNLVQV